MDKSILYGLVVSFLLILLVPIFDSIFAQQFEEPNYEIRGGKVLGFEIDPETASLIISLDAKSRGELIITLPRNLIDAKNGPDDSDFNILVSGINLNFFDETTTETDRTITIPFGRSDFEVIITGTQIFSQITPAQTTQSKVIEQIIQEELKKEIPENQAKLLIFSDTEWSGALQSTSYDFSEIVGQTDTSVLFGCEPSFGGEGMFGAKIQKTTQDGYLKIVVIQNKKIMAQGSTEAPFGEVLINGNCVSNFNSGPQGGGCLIATATFGSELSPQIQQLRELRDNKLLQTEFGLAFMQTFNEFYYSFSPYIADYERENPLFREAVKITITPMISSLSILNHVDINSEFEVLTYGISLILLNIGMYFAVPAILIVSIKKNRKKFPRSFLLYTQYNDNTVDKMSITWRERLSQRRQEIGIDGPEYDYILKYIEFYCSEADRRCQKIDMNKTVDEVIDSMKDKKFDQFTKGVIDSVHKKRGYDPDDDNKKEISALT